jgi:glycosyltransferase involved in cell wall biosynthesis
VQSEQLIQEAIDSILPERSQRWLGLSVFIATKSRGHTSMKSSRTLKKINPLHRAVVSLRPDEPPRGNVLISHLIELFVLKPSQPVPHSHTRYWEATQIVKIFLDFGYCVDIISCVNKEFIPRKSYSFFIGLRFNFERIAPLLNQDCVKILHSETAHILFHNAAESKRLLALYQRRGITLSAWRWEWPNKAIEHTDYIMIKGNEFTMGTYQYTNKPLYPFQTSTTVVLPWPQAKDFDACRNRFLWFGSGGMVHKGLDLVLEAFEGMPEFHLTVCGPIQEEKDFERAFYKELYETPNIHTVGWVDTQSAEFREITARCIGLVYASCSEGQSGAVVECLHAGLIPIISYESGVDSHDFGITLQTCSIDEIRDAVRMVANLPAQEIKRMARAAWEFARANHTRERFAEEYRKVISQIMAACQHDKRPSQS